MTKILVLHSVSGYTGKNYSLKTHLKFVSIVFKFFCALSGGGIATGPGASEPVGN